MNAALSALAPNKSAIQQALEHLFGGLLDGLHEGLIEIASCEGQGGENPIWRASLFATDELEEAADWAATENLARRNVYVAPALRKPETNRHKRAKKSDVLGTVVLWAEWDDADNFAAAKDKIAFCKPTMGCITGRTPAKRAQAMWRVESAITDIAEIEGAVAGLAAALGGEDDVWNADRLMRLPGSISWRKLDKPERIDEPTALQIGFSDRPAIYPTEQVLKAYPPTKPKSASHGTGDTLPEYTYARGPLGLNGEIADKRERYLRNTVYIVFIEIGATTGSVPTAQELFDVVWPQYKAHADLVTRPGRGMNEAMYKCRKIVQRYHAGDLKVKTIYDIIAEYESRPRQTFTPAPEWDKEPAGQAKASPAGRTQTARALTLTDWVGTAFVGEPKPVEWLVERAVPLGVPFLIAAMGDTGKSFLLLNLAHKVAYSEIEFSPKPLLGGPVIAHGRVVVLTAEDDRNVIHTRLRALDPLDRRLKAPDRLMVVPLPDAGGPFPLVRQGRDGLSTTPEFESLVEQCKAIEDLKLVIFDPLQAFVLADVNADPAAGQFLWTALARLAAETGAAVGVAHHMKKTGGLPIKTIAEAREAIRGSSALVDGTRAVYALWNAEEGEAKRICRTANVPFVHNSVVFGAIVKANNQANREISTYIRNEFGLLEDRTAGLPEPTAPDPALERALVTAIADAARAGQPYQKTGNAGLYKQKARLPEAIQALSKHALGTLIDRLLEQAKVVQAKVGKGSSAPQWLDVPSGPFARGDGEFAPGAIVPEVPE